MNAFEHENTPAGGYGEFLPVPAEDDNEAAWAAHNADFDRWQAEEQEREMQADDMFWEYLAEQQAAYYDDDPSPYDGTYSEM